MGFDCDVFVKTILVCLYSKCGYVNDARKNVVSWTAIICGYIGGGLHEKAVGLFRELLEEGVKPNNFTLVRLGDLASGEWIDNYITESGFHRNVFVLTSSVDMYANCGSMEKALQGYTSNGLPKEALDLFFEVQMENLRPDCYAMVGVLSACARLRALELGNWAKGLMDVDDIALIDFYAKCGSIASAVDIFRMMKGKDRVVFNAIISGLAMNGHVRATFGVFGQLEKYEIQPDGNTFVGLLCGCTHAGLVNDGRRYFDSMSYVFSLSPTIEHYGCMVDLLSRAGLLVEAHNLIKSMPMKPNTIVLGILLGRCRRIGLLAAIP
ncbi:hypothetical protein Ahy_A07g033932 isoform A [Arachis hypogaea]|uniref:Pentatricopeptide repeat-containing protein n=1 Tax=Arachis hypogaea TaxID=3818 RepID=A0A445CAF8_ARAHY|nr:hypothetical protein Ahy_A07g033932 isoform A [Arachis hypogaea]